MVSHRFYSFVDKFSALQLVEGILQFCTYTTITNFSGGRSINSVERIGPHRC